MTDLTHARQIGLWVAAGVLTLLMVESAWPLLGRQDVSSRWYKGNTHTHTLNSDGDSTPDEVVRWYREHGYHFLVLTDHNYLTGVDGLNALHGAADKFLVMKGEEVTDRFGDHLLHVNGLDVERTVAFYRDAVGLDFDHVGVEAGLHEIIAHGLSTLARQFRLGLRAT